MTKQIVRVTLKMQLAETNLSGCILKAYWLEKTNYQRAEGGKACWVIQVKEGFSHVVQGTDHT